jgi:hypothetical protein
LDSVASEVVKSDGSQNTFVTSGSETGILHRLPDQPLVVSSSSPTASLEKVSKSRHTRKPR